MRTARRTAQWAERPDRGAPPRELYVLAFLAPLLRPEGLLATAMVALALALRATGRARLLALVALPAASLPGLLNLLFAGSSTTTTAVVKWLPLSPYLDGGELAAQIWENVVLLFDTLLDGRVWSAVFLPEGSRIVLWPAVPALILAGVVRRARVRAGLVSLSRHHHK
jgi:hypothetical protein